MVIWWTLPAVINYKIEQDQNCVVVLVICHIYL